MCTYLSVYLAIKQYGKPGGRAQKIVIGDRCMSYDRITDPRIATAHALIKKFFIFKPEQAQSDVRVYITISSYRLGSTEIPVVSSM